MVETKLSADLVGVASTVNMFDNGGFEIWQRGTSFPSPANNTYTVDRWKVNVNTVSLAVARSALSQNGNYCAWMDLFKYRWR